MSRPESAQPKSVNQRQAEFQARQRARSPLERALRRPAGHIYTGQELEILAELREAEAVILDRAGRLNALLTARMNAAALDPEAAAESRLDAAKACAALASVVRLTRPGF